MIQFKPWVPFHVIQDPSVMKKYFEKIGREAKKTFLAGLRGGHSGRMYGSHQASAAGEYPASDSGALAASTSYEASEEQVTLSADVSYAIYLRHGTRKMARRKMLDTALEAALAKHPFEPGEWTHFGRRKR